MTDSSHSEHSSGAEGGSQKENDRLTVPDGPGTPPSRSRAAVEFDILARRDALAERIAADDMRQAEREIERMPAWVSQYLAAFGSKRPDGKRMTVQWAAEFAGTRPGTVREYRRTSPAFRKLEEVARFGDVSFMSSYVNAGLRGLAPAAMEALADLIYVRNPQVVLKALSWLRGPEELEVTMKRETEVTADDMAEAARRAAELEAELLDDDDPLPVGDDGEGDDA